MTHFKANMIKKGIYKHFKGNFYEVIDIAKHSETEEDMVVYRSLVNGTLWVRPLKMWNEIVKKDGKVYHRFAYIGEKNEKN